MNEKVKKLLEKGVRIPNPESVEIGEEVNAERISGDNVTICSGCKIYGGSTLIMRGAEIGYEAPVTVEDCQIGPDAELKGGFFSGAVFLEKASMGSGSHVRKGTILEEEANIAHTVGLKQTILFPFVTLGSLINFCDCFMAGGTSRKDHSEVGSSYIHFNYTPYQDKATPSMFGDVPGGVMLNKRPIFLGGQGGAVGPLRLGFGTVVGAGSICRKDELRNGRLIIESNMRSVNFSFTQEGYQGIKRILVNNIEYIANLFALMKWYSHARSAFVGSDFPQELFVGLKQTLDAAIGERIKRLGDFSLKTPDPERLDTLPAGKKELVEKWPEMKNSFDELRNYEGNVEIRDAFLNKLDGIVSKNGKNYIKTIKSLDKADSEAGTAWLRGIVDHVADKTLSILSFGK